MLLAFRCCASAFGDFPEVLVVLDHVGNPPWQADDPDLGLGLVSQLADAPNLVLKFATLNLNRLDAASVSAPHALQRLVEMFGARASDVGLGRTQHAWRLRWDARARQRRACGPVSG